MTKKIRFGTEANCHTDKEILATLIVNIEREGEEISSRRSRIMERGRRGTLGLTRPFFSRVSAIRIWLWLLRFLHTKNLVLHVRQGERLPLRIVKVIELLGRVYIFGLTRHRGRRGEHV